MFVFRIKDQNVIEFELPRMSNMQVYLPNRIGLIVTVKLVDALGNKPADEDVVAPCNDIINSLWEKVIMNINDRKIKNLIS